MSDEYLWDKSGPPDPEILELERLLSGFAAPPPKPLELPQRPPVKRLSIWSKGLAFAASIALIATLLVANSPTPETTSVEGLSGSPIAGLTAFQGKFDLEVGSWLRTDSNSEARLLFAIGQVTVAPDSLVRVIKGSELETRLELRKGFLSAVVKAPPRLFFIETPAATAVDLGCAYDLEIKEDGSGFLRVTQGWVALETKHDFTAYIPQGAVCPLRSKQGPGIPFFINSPPRFKAYARALESGLELTEEEWLSFLDLATPKETLTLWHLFQLQSGETKRLTLERIHALLPLPVTIKNADILANKKQALLDWKEYLSTFWFDWVDVMESKMPTKRLMRIKKK